MIQKSVAIFSLIFLVLFQLCLRADPVDTTYAKEIALNYYIYRNQNKSHVSIKRVNTTHYKGIETRHTIIFDNLDYVVVSADDATVPILAYSTENSYRENDIPPSFEDWMETEYDALVYFVHTSNISNTNTIGKWNQIMNNHFDYSKSSPSVSPFISSRWGQSFTNDGQCPGYNYFAEPNLSCGSCDHCTSGCVAVAMAQIMNFWRSPSDDYNWCNMPDVLIKLDENQYERPAYETERNAIATLIYDCGIKAEMDYCRVIDGDVSCRSGTTIGKAKRALQNDFNYSDDMTHRYRTLTINWKTRLKNSIDNGYPVLYGGDNPNTGSGHAFVCDGYEDDNYFHFNWGWNGNSDGYFYIDDDDGNPVIDYRSWQEAVFDIHPAQPGVVYCIDCSEAIFVSNAVSPANPYNPDFPLITWNGLSPLSNYIPQLNPVQPFASDIIYENGEIRLDYHDIKAGTMDAENTIIPNKVNVTFAAYQSIHLKPGFHAWPGSKFSAQIIPCPNNSISAKANEAGTAEKNEPGYSEVQNQSLFMAIPNPFSQTTQIQFSIDQNEAYELSLFDIYGTQIKTQADGICTNGYCYQVFALSDFPAGIYLCVLKSRNETRTLKLIKLSE